MKQVFFSLVLGALSLCISAQTNSSSTRVSGYTKKNGTYVAPSHRTTPNHTQKDNYSTKGNTNPYNGKAGTKTSKK